VKCERSESGLNVHNARIVNRVMAPVCGRVMNGCACV